MVRQPIPRNSQSGYALLLVLLMAAIIAISLYSEIPRVAFQSQRHKEQLLTERGLQYIRGIQVYQQVNKGAWPRNLDDVENFQNRHFARHHYIDPMTGKDDWRLIHIQGNVLTDSLLTQKSNPQQQASTQSTYISDYSAPPPDDQLQKPQDHRRPSEGGGAEGAPGDLPMTPVASNQPGTPPDAGATPGASPNSGANASAAGQPGTPNTPVAPGVPVSSALGYLPGQPSVDPNASASGNGAQNSSGQPPAPGLPGAAGNPALSMINRLLTGPSPQTAPAQSGSSSSSTSSVMGGGLAGVASKATGEGIMVYNGQTVIKKWEFVFDPTAVGAVGVASSGTPGLPSSSMSGSLSSPGSSMTPASGLSSAFGGSPMGTTGLGQTAAPPTSMMGSSGIGTSTSPPGTQGSSGAAAAGPGGAALPPGYRPGRP